jgi:HlyD family secretion protein
MLSGCGSVMPETVPVVLGSVTSGVTASGTLQYVDEQKVGFPQGGRLTSIKVKVGDRVVPGQLVAEVENLTERMALRKAEDQVRIEQLKLDQANASDKTRAPRQEKEDNQKQLDTARRFLREVNEKNQDLIKRVEKKLNFDRDEVERFQRRLDKDRPCLQVDSDLLTPGIQPDQGCIDRVRADLDAVKAAQATVLQSKAELELARNTLETERLDRQLSVDEKTKDRNLAGNNAEFEKTDRPFTIDVQRVTLDAAGADLAVAQKALQDTIKPVAYSGIVDRINGQVGQVLLASHSTPGGEPVKGPAGGDLIVLKDVNAYQVVVPFSEASGSRITPDKAVDVTFDEIPGLTSQARIASIEPPAADAASKTYMVTVVLNQNDPRLTDGLSARVTVALDRVDNTLAVPASAVRVNGRVGLVTLQQPDGTRRDVPVELGMAGDRMIEILSGVRENDQVVVNE